MFAVRANFVGFRVHLDFWRVTVQRQVFLSEGPRSANRDQPLSQTERVADPFSMPAADTKVSDVAWQAGPNEPNIGR